MTTERIFTYGMLLRDAASPATLADWRLEFDGHATIDPAPGEQVHGGVIETDEIGLLHYDAMEGVAPNDPSSLRGYYRRIPVRLTDGTYAWVYVMNPSGRGAKWGPNEGYVRLIRFGYDRFGYDHAPVDDALSRLEVTA